MRFVIIVLMAIFIGTILYFVIRKRLNKLNMIIVGILFVIIIIVVGFYTFSQNQTGKKDADLIASFLRNENLQCGDIVVNKNNFNFISGTLSFVGKENTDFFRNVIPIEKCY